MSKKNALLDTDIVLKIGGFTEDKLLRKILMSLQSNLFIHEYLVQEELIFGELALSQLHEMIELKEVTVLKTTDLYANEILEYESALVVLAREMKVDLNKKRDKNAGEVRSMAIAFAKDFEYFISDDAAARVAAKKHLQKLNGTYLTTIRMKDIIVHIRDHQDTLNISRKTAKNLYLYGVNPKFACTPIEAKRINEIRTHLKNDFEQSLWPID